MSTGATSERNINEQKGNTMQDAKAQVKSIDDFTGLDQLSGLQKWERETLKKRCRNDQGDLLWLGRVVASNDGGPYKYTRSLAKALDRADFIRHDLDSMTVRLLNRYAYYVGWVWFHRTYENLERSLEKQEIGELIAQIVQDYPYTDDYSMAGLAIELGGLTDTLGPEQQAQFKHSYDHRGPHWDERGWEYRHRADSWIGRHLPPFMNAGGDQAEKQSLTDALDSAAEILSTHYFSHGHQRPYVSKKLLEMTEMSPYGEYASSPTRGSDLSKKFVEVTGMRLRCEYAEAPTPDLPIDELWLPTKVRDYLKRRRVEKVSDLRSVRNLTIAQAEYRDEWQIIRTSLILRGFSPDFVGTIPFDCVEPAYW